MCDKDKGQLPHLPEAFFETTAGAVPAQGGPRLWLGRGVHGAEAPPAAARQQPRVRRSPGGVGVVWFGLAPEELAAREAGDGSEVEPAQLAARGGLADTFIRVRGLGRDWSAHGAHRYHLCFL